MITLLGAGFICAACGSDSPPEGQIGFIQENFGGVVSDEIASKVEYLPPSVSGLVGENVLVTTDGKTRNAGGQATNTNYAITLAGTSFGSSYEKWTTFSDGKCTEKTSDITRFSVEVRLYQPTVTVFDAAAVEPSPTEVKEDLPGGAWRIYGQAEGINHVFVNGTQVVEGKEFAEARPGTLLRAGRDTHGAPIK